MDLWDWTAQGLKLTLTTYTMESFVHLILNLLVIKSIVNELLTTARIVIGASNLVGYSRKNFTKLN